MKRKLDNPVPPPSVPLPRLACFRLPAAVRERCPGFSFGVAGTGWVDQTEESGGRYGTKSVIKDLKNEYVLLLLENQLKTYDKRVEPPRQGQANERTDFFQADQGHSKSSYNK